MQRGVRLVVEGALSRSLEFDNDVVIGRGATAHIRFPLPQVSLSHARVFQRDEVWWIEDLGSKNGTTWNGVPLEPGQPVPLGTGGVLALGALKLHLHPAQVSATLTLEISNTFSREIATDLAVAHKKKAPKWALAGLLSLAVAAAIAAVWLLTPP